MPIVVLSEELEAKDVEMEVDYVLKAKIGSDADEAAMQLLKLKPITKNTDITSEKIIQLAQVIF